MTESVSDEDYLFYYALKAESRRIVSADINARNEQINNFESWSKVTLSSIDHEATEFARLEWTKYYGPHTHNGFAFSWERLYHKFRHRPAFFDIAIWQIVDGRRVLQGLALGKPSRGKTRLSLNWVERSFAPTYMRPGILLPVLACTELYAKFLGCERVLIREPVDPDKYARYGYVSRVLKGVGKVMLKELGNGN